MRNYLAVLALLVALGSSVWSTGIDVWGEVTQPDGTTFVYHAWGDEFGGNRETADGYAFVYGSDGWAYYAELDSRGEYRASTHKVGIDDPSSNGIPKNLQRSAARIAEINSVRIAHGYARRPESSVQGIAGAPAHFVCSPTNKCKGYVVLVTFPPETDPKKSFYNGYDQPYGYSWDLFNQFFNGGYDGLAAYKGTTALPRQATGKAAETEAVFGSLRAYFDEVYGGDIIEFEILNKKDAATGLPMWLQLPKTKYDYADLSGGSSTFWNDAEAAVRADDTNGDVLNPVPSSTAPSPFPYKTAPASTAATLLANKAIYVYSGLTPTNYSPLHPRVDVTTWSDANTRGIGARMVMGERQGWEDWGHPPDYKDKEHSVDRFAGIGLHVHEWGHLFGFIHPDGLWEGPNPHPTPQQTNASFDPANLLGWGSMQSGAHGPKIAGQNKDGTPSHYNLAYRSCPNPYNPFYRMDLGWNKKEKITSSMSDKNILPGPAHIYVVPSINGQDYLLDFRTNSTFGQYVGYHRFESSPGILIWRRASGTADSNPMLIPADGRSIDDARPGGGRDSKDIMFDDLPSDPFAAVAQTYGPTVTEATDATHLLHATQKSVGSNKNLRSANPAPASSYLAFRNITITSDDDGTYASVDIHFIPLPPTKLTASSGSTNSDQVTLCWDTPDRNGDTITGYQYSTDGGDNWVGVESSAVTPIGALTEYIITGLKGTNYIFQVRTVTDGVVPHNVSSPSNDVSFTFDRPGMVKLKLSEEPSRDLNNLRVGDVLMATATDPNMSADAWEGDDVSWQWERGTVSGDGWTGSSIADATNADYMLTAADVGQQVRATVRYNDGVGRAADTAASDPTAVVVGGLVLSGPTEETVYEVVLPATAPRKVATYEATAADGTTVTWSLAGSDKNAFTIHGGVLTFKSGPNYEHPTDAEDTNTYHVTVVATAGTQTATVDMKVKVENADDPGMMPLSTLKPQLGHSIKAVLSDEDGRLQAVQFLWFVVDGDEAIDIKAVAGDGVAVSEGEGPDGPITTLTLGSTSYVLVGHRLRVQANYEDAHGWGKQAVSVDTEPVVGPPNRPPAFTKPDPNLSFDENGSGSVVSYTATDPDDDPLKWSLSGADAGAFHLEGIGSTRDLHFNSPPNFEVQSRYGVEVVVSDERASATVAATVAITNVEEAGHISLSPDPPQAGESITATLSDPDGSISGVLWSWAYFSASGTAEASESAGSASSSRTKTIQISRTKAGSRIEVYASYTDGHGSGKKAQSARSSPITAPRPTDTSGSVSLSPTAPQAGQSITATLSDPDTPITVQRWTWLSANASAEDADAEAVEDADAEGANGSLSRTLTISNALVGKKLKARVSYTDSFGSQTAESAYTSPVAAAPDQLGSISLSPDPPQAGESMTATLSDPDGSISRVLWSWTYFSASGTAEASASEEAATSSLTKTIPISRTKAGSRIQVSASYTDGHGSGKKAQSARSSPITDPPATDTSGRVSLSTTAPQAGQSITATLSDPDTPITVQRWTWLSANASADDASESVEDADAEGANGSLSRTLTISNALVGKKLKARVSYTDSFGSQTAESAYTSPVDAAPDQPGSISLSPDPPQAGESMTATLSDPDGSISGVLWSWTYFSASGTAEATETASESAGAASLTKTIPIARTRSGYRIQVYASYTDRHGSGKKAQSARSSPITAPRPTDTSGRVSLSTTTPQAGQSITATLSDPDTPITVQRWTWFSANASAADDESESVEDADVEGASGSLSRSLTISNALVGKKLKARVSYTDSFGSQTAESAYTSPVAAASDQPGSISLSTTKPQVGQPITATLSDPDGRVSNLRWSWLYFSASGASEGSEEVSGTGLSSTFTPSSVLAGIRLRARVLYDDGHGTGKSAESDKTDPVTHPSSKPVAASLTTPPDSELAFRVAPNPFNPTTSLQLHLPVDSPVWLTIYNITGQVVRTLLVGHPLAAGYHTFHWDGHDQQGYPATSGVYLYRVQTTKQVLVGKMALIR